MSFKNKFRDKNVVITGHTGFKGSWLTFWLKLMGANIIGISLDPKTSPSNFETLDLSKDTKDIRLNLLDRNKIEDIIVKSEPDFIFHLAAQAIVKQSYIDPIETWQTNLMGTINILEILKKIKKKCSVVLITSDKCYRNKEWLWGYREIDELGGIDPYSASKAATEIAIRSYSQSFFQTSQSNIRLGSARAGNVIGGGDWSKDRLLPDCIKSWSQDKTVILRNPSSTRPWQHVLEPLSGYIWLASKLDEDDSFNGESFNFGPMDTEPQTVLSVVNEISKHWKKVSWEIQQDETAHESGLLKLNCDKANQLLNWQSVLSFKKTIQITSEWYKEFYNEKLNMKDFTKYQIEEYMKLANEKNIEWAL